MPFASDKQRRYLWSQKPEVAKKFAEHKAEGGEARPWWAGPKTPEWALKAVPAAAEFGAGFVPGVGEVMDAKDAYDAWSAGDYAAAAGIAGVGALGLIPGVGDAIAGGARAARRAAPLAGTALKHLDKDYADLALRELKGTQLPAKSVGASANLGTDPDVYKVVKHPKALEGEYTRRFGLPNTPEARKATSDILADATAIRRGERVDAPEISVGKTSVYPDVNPASRGQNRLYGKVPGAPEYLPNNPQSLVDYALPTKAKWKELYPNTPYPTKKPGVLTAKERAVTPTGKKNPAYTGKEEPFSTVEGDWRSKGKGRKQYKDIAPGIGPLSDNKPTTGLATVSDEKARRLAALKAAGLI